MTFRVNGLGQEYAAAQKEALNLRNYAVAFQTQLAAGDVSANAVIQCIVRMAAAIQVWDRVAAIPGLAAYAQNEENDPAYDVVAEFTAMRTETVGVRDWILTNFPTAPSGEIIKDTLENDGSISVRVFTPAQTTGLQSALGLLVATIDG